MPLYKNFHNHKESLIKIITAANTDTILKFDDDGSFAKVIIPKLSGQENAKQNLIEKIQNVDKIYYSEGSTKPMKPIKTYNTIGLFSSTTFSVKNNNKDYFGNLYLNGFADVIQDLEIRFIPAIDITKIENLEELQATPGVKIEPDYNSCKIL